MITSNGVEDLVFDIIAKGCPVLLAYISGGYDHKSQSEVLDNLSNIYGDSLKVCLLSKEFNKAFNKFKIEGTPTFITFHKGKEKGRLLGKSDMAALNAFVCETLPCFSTTHHLS